MARTRGKLERSCLVTLKLPGSTYSKHECGNKGRGAEFIGQARAIALLNTWAPDRGSGVSPNLQWEMVVQGFSPSDILYYKRDDASVPIQMYEVKGNWQGTASGAIDQLDGYIKEVGAATGRTVVRGTQFGADYEDSYRIEVEKCPNDSARQFDDYHVTQPQAGLLWIEETEHKCPGQTPPPRKRGDKVEDDTDLPLEVPEPDPVALPTPFPGDLTGQPTPVPKVPLPVGVVARNPCGWWVCVSGDGVTVQWDDIWNGIEDGATATGHWLENAGTALNGFMDKIGRWASSSGDPHYTTLDGLHYDLQAVGEFTLAQSPSQDLSIQARLVPIGANVSHTDRIVFQLNGFTIEIAADGTVLVDGVARTLANGTSLYTGNGSALVRSDDRGYPSYSAIWPGTNARPILRYVPALERVQLWVPPGTTDVSGLLGNADGQSRNDLKFRDGTQLPYNASAATIHGSYANSWRITDAESLFRYAAGKSTASYTDLSFPQQITTVSDLAPEDATVAAQTCTTAGVSEGPQFDDCVLDIVLTSSQRFAESAATIVRPALDAQDWLVDGSGKLTWDFEATTARNVSPTRLSTGTSATRFAGPFGNSETYGFAVPEIPSHSRVTVTFDVLTVGNWDSDSDTESVSLQVNGVNRWSATKAQLGTATSTGTLANGSPYAVYRQVVDVEHLTPQLQAVIRATNVNSLAAQGFGIDNVTVQAALQQPDAFTASLPLTASNGIVNGTAAAKAGNLETKASQDSYRFALASAGSLLVDLGDCPGTFTAQWVLVNEATGVTAASGYCWTDETPPLPTGNYRLDVGQGGFPTPGPYTLDVRTIPPPQTFTGTLPLVITDGTVNGVAAAGAGNLETKVSQDVYRFSVAAGAQPLSIVPSLCPGPANSFLAWKIVDDATSSTITEGDCTVKSLGTLAAGTYRLIVTPSLYRIGAYGLSLQPSQLFAAAVPLTVTSGVVNGTATTGAGNLETKGSEDVYRFTVPAGGLALGAGPSNCPLGGVIWEVVNEATGGIFKSGSGPCEYTSLGVLPAGTYRLLVRVDAIAGTYSFALQLPQTFAATLPLEVRNGTVNGTAVAGAGNLETKASEDIYRFTVPTGGLSLSAGPGSCPLGGLDWSIVEDVSSVVLKSGTSCTFTAVGPVPAGTYRLQVRPSMGYSGTYTFSLAAPQSFTGAVPLTISNGKVNGVTVAGAGNLEGKGSQDVYRFTVPTGGLSLAAGPGSCPGSGVDWTIVNEGSGSTIKSDTACAFTDLGLVPAGQYRLTIKPYSDLAGTYTFAVHPPQLFIAAVPLTVSNGLVNGATAPGAGNLETEASQDVYRFTVPAGGLSLAAGPGSCPSIGVDWAITNETTAAVVKSAQDCAFTALGTLAAGPYRLTVKPYSRHLGTYMFSLLQPQTFNTALPLSVSNGKVNGVTATGAGNLETEASQDVYRFTVPAGGLSLAAGPGSCPIAAVDWAITNETTGAVVKSAQDCAFTALGTLAAGPYRLTVKPFGRHLGTYTFSLLQPQTFTTALPLSVSNGKVNGVTATGAGNLEAKASQDIYRFTVAAGTHTVTVSPSACPTLFSWELANDATGTSVKTGTCTAASITGVTGGSYRLVVRPSSGYTGTYAITASAP